VKSILLDIDVIIDVLARREPFFAPAANLWAKVENKHIRAYLASHTITTLFYLISKVKDKKFAEECVRDLLSVFEIAPVDKPTLLLALKAGFKDFEDAVQHAAAKQVNADFIITRNIKDFRKSDIPIASPDSFLATLKLAD
jgi:predicted nucleic acid-binding protein